jgi:dimethylglycine dehydrogenase
MMKKYARGVVVGGGIVGCSVLYHLTKLGWRDVVLMEKNELTSGSTWLSAGNVPQFSLSRSATRLIRYSIELYQKLEAETGQATGWHGVGSLRLATTRDRLDEFKHVRGKDKFLGIESELLGPMEMKKLFPLMSLDGVIGGLFHPQDGHVDASGVTQALAAGARQGGAEIYRYNRVIGLKAKPGGEWEIETEKGKLGAEIVVLVPGPWAKQVAAMIGLYLPVISMEHHHVLFDEIPELRALSKELPVLRDPDVPFYLRQELNTMLVGPYEKQCRAWKPDGVPWEFSQSSIPPDLERFHDNLLRVIERVPVLERPGIKHVINGPIPYTPDGTPFLGPVYGHRNIFILAGINFGITLAGGFGRHMAQWIVSGDPGLDLSAYDPRRFGNWVTRRYAFIKVHESYRVNWEPAYPDRERPAARPVKTSPIYDLLASKGAVFGSRYGWERANWFAAPGQPREDRLSFRRRTNYFDQIGRECRAVRDSAAVYELSSLAKYEICGPGAEAFLDRLCTNRLPREGRAAFTLMLTAVGLFQSDYILVRLAQDHFYVLTAAAAELRNLQWLENHKPEDVRVSIRNVTSRFGMLAVVGPESRRILEKLTEEDWSNQSFPYYSWQERQVGLVPVRALRLNYIGELGWELHHPIEYQRGLYEAIMLAGEEFGLTDCGMRALNSLRLEKGYCGSVELSGEDTPWEAALEAYVKMDKGGFIGRDSLLRQLEGGGLAKRLVLLDIEAGEVDAFGDEPIYQDDRIVGRITSGGYGHRLGKSLALAYVWPEASAQDTELEVEILDERFQARVAPRPLYDPDNQRLRG